MVYRSKRANNADRSFQESYSINRHVLRGYELHPTSISLGHNVTGDLSCVSPSNLRGHAVENGLIGFVHHSTAALISLLIWIGIDLVFLVGAGLG